MCVDKQSLIDKGMLLAQSGSWFNCRLFAATVTETFPESLDEDFCIEDMPRQEAPSCGSLLWWGTHDPHNEENESYLHLAVALDEDTVIQVPECGGSPEVLPLSKVETYWGPVCRIYQSKLQQRMNVVVTDPFAALSGASQEQAEAVIANVATTLILQQGGCDE